ncbi:MAG: arginine--tRNA ligase [Patescibacteria group bacterium]|jgi:arginyl-tRNA synthetase
MMDLKKPIEEAIIKAGYDVPAFDIDVPPEGMPGDYSVNVALLIGSCEQESPSLVAEKIIDNINDEIIEKIEIAGPGFMNIRLKDSFYHHYLLKILKAGANFGKQEENKNGKALIEYISANPTGPLHIGNARGGPIGEVLANVLFWQGFSVESEFYVNDTGAQIKKFGQTLAYWYIIKKDEKYPFPDGGYPGEFLQEVSEEIQKEKSKEIGELRDDELVDFFIKEGLERTIRRIKDDIAALGLHFDRFVYESDIISSGDGLKVVDQLKSGGHTSEKEGALWFTTNDLDPNDRETVLLRSDAEKTPTYFANDIAYHKDKFDRGNNLLIDVWGANHHGHIPRLKGALKALGYEENNFLVVLYQNVRLKKGGEVKQMGKRLGNYINISDLITKLKVPADVFKFMIISQSPSSVIDFDLELALEQSEKNPVYYLQYAYARICSVLRKADSKLLGELENIAEGEGSINAESLTNLKDKKELELIRSLIGLPSVLKKVSDNFQIQALPHFATEVARAYHNFYSSCQILSDDQELTKSRLLLVLAARNVLKISLTLMGISAPEKM